MLKDLLLGIGIGGIIFTKKGKDIVNSHINSLKDYMINNISNTDIIKVGKEFLNGFNNISPNDEHDNNKQDELTQKSIKKEISKKY